MQGKAGRLHKELDYIAPFTNKLSKLQFYVILAETRIKYLLVFFIYLISNSGINSYAQNPFPENRFLYTDDDVARIDIFINPDSLNNILEGDLNSDYEYPAQFTITRGAKVKTIDSVGFRLRGNTSRFSQKKSFKVSINSFTPGKSYEKIEKINLNGEHNDPSIARAKICWDLFDAMGVAAPRANHVELYINNDYRGLYLNVEHIDENFTKLRFGNNDGNLYKCLWPADLNYIGSDPEQYKYTQDNRRAYELQRNNETDDYSDLSTFIEILNKTETSDLPEYLEPVFNVNSYLKILLVEILTGHWDNYAFNKNNFYLYHNENTGKFEYIPYDLDNTFGIDWFGIDWGIRNIYNWSKQGENRPLYEKIIQNQLYRDRFSFYVNRFITNYFTPELLDPKLDSLRGKTEPYKLNDIYSSMDYGYSYDDFYNSFDIATGNHVKYGIKQFIETRSNSASEQLDLVNIAPIISQVVSDPDSIGNGFVIAALIEDEEFISDVFLYYDKGEGFTGIPMISAGREIYQAALSGFTGTGILNYYIEARDNLSQMTREPYMGVYSVDFSISVNKDLYHASASQINVFPNPFSSYLNFSFPGEFENVIYRIMDVSGKTVIIGETNQSDIRINTSQNKFSNGIYFFQCDYINPQNHIIKRESGKLLYKND
jgi:hypothetical protein